MRILESPKFCFGLEFLSEDTVIKELLINNQIREREVRLLDQDGTQLGIMSSREASAIADSRNLDLVLISPTAKPPVCKIMDYGKYKYEMIKREKENRKNQKVVEIKEVRLSATIDTGDMITKSKQALKFLSEENRVKVSLRLRGRQMARPELAVKVMNEFFEMVKEKGQMDKPPVQEGRSITMMLAPIAKK
mgnify:FL=1